MFDAGWKNGVRRLGSVNGELMIKMFDGED